MTRDIAHGRVVIDIDVDRAMAELEAAKGQIRKTMSDVDRMDAEASVSIDKKALRRDIGEIKSEIKALEAERATIKTKLDKKGIDAELKKLRAKLADHQAVEIMVKVDDSELKDLDSAERKLATLRKKRAAEQARLEKAQSDELRRRIAIQARSARLEEQMVAARRKEAVEVEKLRVKYIRLHDEIERGRKLEMFDFLGDEAARRKFAATAAELRSVGQQLKDMGDSDDDLRRLGKASDSSNSRLRNMVSSLASIRLQMGFFSATIRQAALGFTVLGPVIFGVIGQIVSLAGVLGTGLAGALAVSTAGALGFAGAALGIGLIVKPMINDLQDAKKASDAYGDAVRKYGKDSSQAQTAQEKLNKTLGDIGPEARQGFKELGQMSDRWSKLTQGNRKPFFETMGKGIKLASSYLPMFARESNKTFDIAANAAENWLDMLDAPEARNGIQQILSNFRSSIPGLNAGFISIGKTIGNIGASGSRWLKPLSEGFSDWADNLFQSLDQNGGLDSRIDRLVEHMRQIGQFAQSAGSMLATFFSAGANEGANLLSTLTNIFDRWTAWMNTAQGQSGLSSFFSQANALGSQFVSTLGNIGLALFEFSQAFAPLSQGALAFVRAMSGLTAAVMGLAPARGIVTALGGALASAFVATKITAATGALAGLGAAIRGLMTGGGLASLAALTNPIGAIAFAVGGAVAALSLLGSAGDDVRASLDALDASMAKTSATIDAMAGNDAAAASAKIALGSAQQAVRSATVAANNALNEYGEGSRQAKDAENSRQAALQNLTDTQMRYGDAVRKSYQDQRQASQGTRDDLKDAQNALSDARENMDKLNKSEVEGLGNPFEQAKRGLTDLIGLTDTQSEAHDALNDAYSKEQEALRNIARLKNELADSDLDARRRSLGLASITQKLGAEWRNIRDSMPKRSIGEIVKMNPKDAAQAIRLSSSLKDLGRGGQAARILVNTKNVDEAIAKLRRLQQSSTTLVKAKVEKGQAERDLGKLGKGKTATVNTKANTKAAERDLSKLSGKQLANRITIRANSSQAMSELNKVERKQLRTKLLHMKANPAAVNAAIAIINNKKIPDKLAKFTAETSQAEAGNKKVQGFKDKDVKLDAKWEGAGGVAAANAAIASLPSSKTTVLTTIHKDVYQSSGRAAGGFHSFASGGVKSPMPAQEKRYAASAERADRRQARPGVYRRPTLLVGEENRKEYVISTNDSYRGVNEGYLRAAANEFGYDLAPIQMAAKGYKPLKPMTGHAPRKGYREAKRFPRYDYLSGKVSYWDDRGSNLEAKRSLMLEAGETTGVPSVDSILQSHINEKKALENLRDWIRSTISKMQKKTGLGKAFGSSDRERKEGNKAIRLKKQIRKKRGTRPKDAPDDWSQEKKKVRATAQRTWDKDMQELQDDLTKAQNKRDRARDKTRDLNSEMGRFKRELEQQMPGRLATLDNDIARWKYIKDDKIDDPTKPSDSDSTPTYGVQLGQLDAARYENFRQFGSNIAALGPGAAAGGVPGGPSGYAASGAAPATYKSAAGGSAGAYAALSGQPAAARAAQAGAASAGGGNTTVKQVINISEPPPDPHSFSKQLGWEAAAMLG